MGTDERPPVWVGHIALGTNDLAKSTEWWTGVGMRLIVSEENVTVLELRGGTHLVLLPAGQPVADGTPAGFDLMVEDIEATHRAWAERGFEPSGLDVGQIHTSFTVRDPSGYVVTVNSTHVSDEPV